MKCTSSDTQKWVHRFSCRPQAAGPCVESQRPRLIYTEPIAFERDPRGNGTMSCQHRWPIPRGPGRPRRLFETTPNPPVRPVCSTPCYSMSPDGQSFYTCSSALVMYSPRDEPAADSQLVRRRPPPRPRTERRSTRRHNRGPLRIHRPPGPLTRCSARRRCRKRLPGVRWSGRRFHPFE